jgi:hypothetical protein
MSIWVIATNTEGKELPRINRTMSPIMSKLLPLVSSCLELGHVLHIT